MSEEFDFTIEDRVPDAAFNKVLWFAQRGESSDCPAPVHSAFLNSHKEDDD